MERGASVLPSLKEGLRTFLTWWRDELSGLVPERVRQVFARGRPETVLAQVEEDGFVVVGDAPGGARADELQRRQEALAQLASIAKPGTAVGVRVPIDLCFARTVELPMAARNDLQRILDFDLERATPFKHKDVYTGHVVEAEAATRGKLSVLQLVAKRETIDPLVADVRAAGLVVGFVDCWSDRPSLGMPINFLEPRGPGNGGRRRVLRPAPALAGLAVLLGVSALVLTIWGYERALADLQAKAGQARAQAATVRGILERSDAVVADLARLQDLKLKRVPAIQVLEEVSRILPDSVWLSELRLEGDVLDMVGLATSAAELPTLFEKSDHFAEAALTAPVTFDQREDKERFGLRVRIKHQAALRQASTGEKLK